MLQLDLKELLKLLKELRLWWVGIKKAMADLNATSNSNTLRNIAESKLVTFAIGQQKKSRFQKARFSLLHLILN